MAGLMILGAGGHGKVVSEIAFLMNKWDEIVFLDDNKDLKNVNGFPVVGGLGDYLNYKDKYEYAFVAIGNNKFRLELIKNIIKDGFTVPILIHPFTYISKSCQIGEGTVIMAGSVINTCSDIGKGCIINTSSSIDHDCILKDGVHISPGAHIGGTTHVGENTWICIGSSIINNITIGNNVVVAAGSVVTRNISNNVMVAGIPAKIKK